MTPGADQYRLDFDGPPRERKAVFLARLAAVDPASLGVGAAAWGNVVRLLESVYFFAGWDHERYAQPSPEALQENADLSRSVLSRARRLAVALGLLTAERPRCRRGETRSPDRLWLQHDTIGRLAAASRCSGGISRDQVGSGGIRWDHIKESPFPPNHQTPNPPPTPRRTPEPPGGAPAPGPHDATEPSRGEGGWGEVVLELERAGLGATSTAVEAARSAGATPADVRAILAAYEARRTPQPAAWGPGALLLRLKRYRPGQGPTEGFPPPNPEHERARLAAEQDARRRRDAARYADRRREHDARAAERAAERNRLAELEAAARALGPGELGRLVESIHDPFVRAMARRDPYGLASLTAIAEGLTTTREVCRCP
jgi:hypothetical protein